MSLYISIIDGSQPPQLLRARGLIVPFGRAHSGALEIRYDLDAPLEFSVLAGDHGWRVVTPNLAMDSLHSYGTGAFLVNDSNVSLTVMKLDDDLNTTGAIDQALSDPVATVTVSMFGCCRTTQLRVGDSLVLGGASFPLPYRAIDPVCRMYVTEQRALSITPLAGLTIDGLTISDPSDTGPSDTGSINNGPVEIAPREESYRIAGAGWLVTLSFLTYSASTVHESTSIPSPVHAGVPDANFAAR